MSHCHSAGIEESEGDGQPPGPARDCGVEEQSAAQMPSSGDNTAAEDSLPRLEQDTDEDSHWDDEEDDDNLPSFEFRVETAKLLIELDEDTHAATQVCY